MPQPDRAPAGGRRVADGVDQVRVNRALRVVNGQFEAQGNYDEFRFFTELRPSEHAARLSGMG